MKKCVAKNMTLDIELSVVFHGKVSLRMIYSIHELKLESHLPKKIIFICFNESPIKITKNAFYFILKFVFVLKISKYLS